MSLEKKKVLPFTFQTKVVVDKIRRDSQNDIINGNTSMSE